MAMCANHPDAVAVAYCRECGKPLCAVCRNDAFGAIYCAEHLPAGAPAPGFAPGAPPVAADPAPFAPSAYSSNLYNAPAPAPDSSLASVAASPYTAPVAPVHHGAHPAFALLLGTIPGVGAIFNGQYAKGLIHAVIFGFLITIMNSNEHGPLAPLVGILIAVWWFYMVFEAFHTAHKRYHGIPVDEFSSLINLRNRTSFPAGALVLIGLGALLLLDTSGLIPVERLLRFWPIALILAGVYMLYARAERTSATVPPQSLPQEFLDERR